MTYEEIELDFERLLSEAFIPFFKERGFKIRQTHFSRQIGDIHQVFHVSKLMRKRKTGIKLMLIQPQIGFFHASISEIIWPGENRSIPKLTNGFLQYDLGLFSGTTFYKLGETKEEQKIEDLILDIKNELTRTVAPIFDTYKSLNDINSFLNENMKFKIYSQHENETEYETVFKRFYYGLAAFFLHSGQKDKATEVLKRKYDMVMTPVPINRVTIDSEGKHTDNISIEIHDFFKDLPFIERLSTAYNLNIAGI